MTATIAITLLVFVLMFVLATVLSINIGTLAFGSAFIIGVLVAGLTPEEVLGSFPADLFVLLVGVTYLFAIAQNNGTVDWLAQASLKLVRGNVALVPFAFAFAAIFLTAIGVYPPAAVAILAPLALSFAARYDISPLLMGVVVLHGVLAGSFSPVGAGGIIVNSTVESADISAFPLRLFVNNLVMNSLFMVAAYLLLGGLGLIRQARRGASAQEHSSTIASDPESDAKVSEGAELSGQENPSEEDSRLNRHQKLTLSGILVFILLVIGFGLDVGLTAFAVGAILTLLYPGEERAAIRNIAWPVALLVTGILTFIGVVEEVGALAYVSNAIASTGSPLLISLLASFVGGLTSLFASTSGILVATLPLLLPGLQQAGFTEFVGPVSALSVASNVVDISPLSSAGAVLLANAQNVDTNVFFRQLLYWAIAMLFVGSILPWMVFVVVPALL